MRRSNVNWWAAAALVISVAVTVALLLGAWHFDLASSGIECNDRGCSANVICHTMLIVTFALPVILYFSAETFRW